MNNYFFLKLFVLEEVCLIVVVFIKEFNIDWIFDLVLFLNVNFNLND